MTVKQMIDPDTVCRQHLFNERYFIREVA